MSRRRLLWLLCLVALVAGAFTVWIVVRGAQTRQRAAAGVPARPALDDSSGHLGARVQRLEDAIYEGDDPLENLGRLAAVYQANGLYPEAQQAYATLRQLQPREPRWLHRAAHIHAVFGELEQAVPLWQEVTKLAPDYTPARVRLGEALLKSGQLNEAAAQYQEALRREPANGYAGLGLARVDVARDDWAAALTKLETVANQTEGLLGADLLATAYERTGQTQRATALRARQKSHGLYVGPSDPWIDELMEECYDPYRLALEAGTSSIRKEFDRTRRLLDRALSLDPNNPNVHYQAGALAEQRGETALARTRLESAVRLNPQLTDAWAALVRVVAATGDQPGSWRILAEALATNPDSPVLLLERGRRFKAQGRIEAAIADFRRVTRLRRDEALAFVELASIYFAQERTQEGLATLEQGLQAEPGHPAALAIIAFASIHAGQQERAEHWLREILDQPRVTAAEVQRLRAAYQEKFGRPAPSRR